MKNPFQPVVFCPPVDSEADGVPGAEGPGDSPSLAAVFTGIDYGVKEAAGIDFSRFPAV
jgi:hypothetical protein